MAKGSLGINQGDNKSLSTCKAGGRQDLGQKVNREGMEAAGSCEQPMKDAQNAAPVVRFGTFEANLHSRELRKHGMRIRLEEKPFQILELLLECPGHVVNRQTLREKLWPDTVVGYEHGLNTAVNKLRDLLGDSARSPRFVETVPRLGY